MNWKKFLGFKEINAEPEEFQELNALFKKYRSLEKETGIDEFERTLFEKLQKVENEVQKPRIRRVPAIVFSVSALFLIVFTFLFYSVPDAADEDVLELVSSSEAEKGEPVKITIEFESTEDLENVEISFRLDDGVRFHSDNEKIKALNSYVWKGSFKKGVNPVPFVVSLVSEGESRIITETKFGGYIHNRTIVLKTLNEKTAVMQFKSKRLY